MHMPAFILVMQCPPALAGHLHSVLHAATSISLPLIIAHTHLYLGFGKSAANTVYSVSLSALTTGMNSNTSKGQIWKEISGLQTTYSTPLSISGSLLAVGGRDKEHKNMTAIHLYKPGTGEWVKSQLVLVIGHSVGRCKVLGVWDIVNK